MHRAPDMPVAALEDRLGRTFPQMAAARAAARERRRELRTTLGALAPPDTTVVVFGSLARDEVTRGSDIDWTLLVDGAADRRHLEAAQEIGRHVDAHHKAPGPEGTFGSMAFGHDLVHQIGGEDDTNSNTTRRILLLLESAPVSDDTAYRRVIEHVLGRYLGEDRGLWYSGSEYKVPRFLLNDIVRYWRTMAVDFVYKQRSRAGRGWPLRNLKLRLSRKLIFVAGLLACFRFQTVFGKQERQELFSTPPDRDPASLDRVVDLFAGWLDAPPLEILATALLDLPATPDARLDAAAELFAAYDDWLAFLDDSSHRNFLSQPMSDEVGRSDIWNQGIQIGRRFQDGLDALFLSPGSPYWDLVRKYAIF